jgi:hypothetical protein
MGAEKKLVRCYPAKSGYYLNFATKTEPRRKKVNGSKTQADEELLPCAFFI